MCAGCSPNASVCKVSEQNDEEVVKSNSTRLWDKLHQVARLVNDVNAYPNDLNLEKNLQQKQAADQLSSYILHDV